MSGAASPAARGRDPSTQPAPELARAVEAVGACLDPPRALDAAGIAEAPERLDELYEAGVAALELIDEADRGRAQALTRALLRLRYAEGELGRPAAARRVQLHGAVEQALGRLRGVASAAELLERVCVELVEGCGFARAMLSRVEERSWIPWSAHFARDPELEPAFDAAIRSRPVPLDELMPESEVLSARRATLVEDSSGDPFTQRVAAAGEAPISYVVAPITPAGRIVGCLHADHGRGGRRAGAAERDALWAFAEGFGRIYERAVIVERLQAQRAYVRDALDLAEEITTRLDGGEVELVRHAYEQGSDRSTPSFQDAGAAIALFTVREREVLELMIAGHTNREIGERLVITEGTVKSHVKHILRKLGAINRAEAIARYLGREERAPR